MLPTAQDYKRIGNNDEGPNTGGMGAVSPAPLADRNFMQKINDRIVVPTIKGLREEGIPYQGFIFFGLICVGSDPYVIEYNVRLGDPETQVILPRLRSDLLDLFEGIATGTLSECHVDIDDRVALGVVMASEGYPGKYETGKEITGIENVQNAYVFQAGTAQKDDKLITAGGRVLTITGFGKSLEHAAANAYAGVNEIEFDGKYNRTDIGKTPLRTTQKA
jgi:phosphoribosylamine--glycine ligase